MTSVTFVGHDASRTGAPLMLLAFLRWLSRHEDVDVGVVLVRGGPLAVDFARVAPTTCLDRAHPRLAAAVEAAPVVGGRVRRVPMAPAALRWRTDLRPSSVVVANSLASLPHAQALRCRGARLICHVHELDHVVERLGDLGVLRARLQQVDRFVAAGPAVESMLVHRLGVPAGRVVTVPSFVDPVEPDPSDVAAVRRSLGSPERVVLAVGSMVARKGPDRFVDLAELLVHPDPGLCAVWLGGAEDDPAWAETVASASALPSGAFRLLAARDDPGPVIAAADLVLSTAREDPFPLSVLEAAALGVPVLVQSAGGADRMLADAGLSDWVVASGDTLEMARRARRILADPAAARHRASPLRQLVLERCSLQLVAPQLWQVIEECAR